MAVARVALPVAAFAAFDYWIPDGLAVERGTLVRVRLAGRALPGVVVDVVPTSEVAREKLQPVAEVKRDLPILPEDLLGLADFVSRYYQGAAGPCAGADVAAARGAAVADITHSPSRNVAATDRAGKNRPRHGARRGRREDERMYDAWNPARTS